ncbi:polyketide cyclase [Aeromicrobium sp. Root495]|uniref:SRPBCC family protein n=1 Tax=Aeromicrobium sp. Root495 TaxID=1736550 RepID=UPI0006F55EAF|nr:SRPBCC family protein [Aeromicrobium sp. Root495]KQY55326.1 polyketide cyclase [Aeromicrobium sp. Root495]
MTINTRTVNATPDQVWSVLADGWLYPLWVVGASRIRGVDPSWPEPGSAIQHSVGVWPALIDDETVVLESVPGHRIKLRAKGWPLGEAHVELVISAVGSQSEISIEEVPTAGPGAVVPPALTSPAIKWRNVETLRRLAYVVENRPQQ